MGNGWIKLHRKLTGKGFYKKSQYVHLWVHLLLSANHKPVEYMTNGHTILIKEGQLLTGRDQLVEATGIPGTSIERILKMLENEHQIGQQKTTKYRLITILHWKEYQDRTEERTSNGHQTDTNKNDKNEKNMSASAEVRDIPIGKEDHQKKERMPKDDKAQSLVDWSIKRRGFKFVSNGAQLGAIGRAKTAGITPAQLKERWIECEGEAWRNGFDWVDVVKTFDRRA